MSVKISISLTRELLDGLDKFIADFERLSRSETIEIMIFYCLSHNEALEEIGDVLEGESMIKEEGEEVE